MKKLLSPLLLGIAGLAMGVLSKLLDRYTTNLGNLFSELSIWILLGVVIAIFSKTRKRACIHIFPFCAGMLAGYYTTAELTGSPYSPVFVAGWALFTLVSPVFAYFTWMTKEKGWFPKVISSGILIFTLLASWLLFDGPRLRDIVILLVLAYLLFFHRVRR